MFNKRFFVMFCHLLSFISNLGRHGPVGQLHIQKKQEALTCHRYYWISQQISARLKGCQNLFPTCSFCFFMKKRIPNRFPWKYAALWPKDLAENESKDTKEKKEHNETPRPQSTLTPVQAQVSEHMKPGLWEEQLVVFDVPSTWSWLKHRVYKECEILGM